VTSIIDTSANGAKIGPTPGDWHVVDHPGSWTIQSKVNGFPLCIAQKYGDSPRANAERIVQACGSHDALLAAARECLEAEERRRADLKPGAPASQYSDARIARIRAAIAKAEGRSA
jgi:hypothetical protein